MWALGLSLLEIVAGEHPFAKMNIMQIIMAIQTWNPVMPEQPAISEDMKYLIDHLYVNFHHVVSCFLVLFTYI